MCEEAYTVGPQAYQKTSRPFMGMKGTLVLVRLLSTRSGQAASKSSPAEPDGDGMTHDGWRLPPENVACVAQAGAAMESEPAPGHQSVKAGSSPPPAALRAPQFVPRSGFLFGALQLCQPAHPRASATRSLRKDGTTERT